MIFDVGDQVRLTATFTDTASAPSDPSEVTLRHRDPAGNVAAEIYNGGAGNVVRDGAGAYHLDLDIDEAGRWYWRAEGTVTPRAAGERSFEVRASQVT